MTVREMTALVNLFVACTDEDLRKRAVELVPELEDFVERPEEVNDHPLTSETVKQENQNG